MQRSIDGLQPRPIAMPSGPHIRPLIARPETPPRPRPETVGSAQPKPAPRKRSFKPNSQTKTKPTLRERLQVPLLILGCCIAGVFFQSLWFGLVAIAVYGICMFIFQINSRVTFALAFISLLTVVALLLFKRDVSMASSFATYTFLLLVLGVIALSVEARPRTRKKRRNGR